MKSLRKKFASKFIGLALLASVPGLSVSEVHAEQSNQRKELNNKEESKFGFDWDFRFSLGHEVYVPGRFIPSHPENDYRSHKSSGTGMCISFGPKIRLNNFLEMSIKYENPKDELNGANYVTYWGGYEIGQYACIGEISTKNSPFNLELCAKTPSFHRSKTQDFITDEARAFISYARSDFDMFYKSGYHMFGQAFYEVEDEFKVGDFSANGLRLGLEYRFFQKFSLKGYYQLNHLDGNLKKEAKDFKYGKDESVIGFEMEMTF